MADEVEAQFIVLRAYAGAPDGWMPQEGLWIPKRRVPQGAPSIEVFDTGAGNAVGRPTGRIESREDGERADVWEVSPPDA